MLATARRIHRYFARAGTPTLLLWCYLLWYLGIAIEYFDRSPMLWINALGMSAVVGTALRLGVAGTPGDGWRTFRLYLTPFCVSSYTALSRPHGFVLVFPHDLRAIAIALAPCIALLVFARLARINQAPISPAPISSE
jgi:hypothetical protein